MIRLNLHQASAMIGGTLVGKDIQFKGVTTDSRQNCDGALFVALKGENFNGEDYCQQALDNGAVAVLVTNAQDIHAPQIICQNSLSGLSILAKYWSKKCPAKIIAITGSNGKTTVKNMLYSIFSQEHQCSATIGNLNNEIGVPLTLCNINSNDDYAIIEMGAAKLGDITWLTSLTEINTAILTNVSAAHIGRFGSLQNIIHEKGQIVSQLSADNHAVLPIDDENFHLWKNNTKANIISFGLDKKADASVSNEEFFNILLKDKPAIKAVKLPVSGKHNQINAASACAAAISFNLKPEIIKKGLEEFIPASGRLENMGNINGNIVINDSYNANPESVKAAIDVLAEHDTPTTLILGDMAELGEESQSLHSEIGIYANNKNITHIMTIGKDSKFASNSFAKTAEHFESLDMLQNKLLTNWATFGTILVKGSRSMQLENLISGLVSSEKVA